MTDVKTSIDLGAWQIGSSGPPVMCLCCGMKFDEGTHRRRGPYLEMPYIWVCQWCWEKDYLFFPDKEMFSKKIEPTVSETPIIQREERSRGTLQLSIVPERRIRLKHVYKKVTDLHFDVNNPRLRHLGKMETEDDVENLLWKEPSTRTLFREIEYTQGLSTPLLVDEGDVVREGNRRLVCLRKLISKIIVGNSDVPMFKVDRVPCYILPRGTQEDDIALYLALEHVTGKKEWRPVNQAGQVYDLHRVYGLSFPRISDILGRSQSSIRVMEKAYSATLEYRGLFHDDTSWMSKYSYFFEAYRHRQTAEWLTIEGNLKRLAGWINSGRVSKGAEIRNLTLIIGDSNSNRSALSVEQKESDKRLISLTQRTREIISSFEALWKQGRLTTDAVKAIQDLQFELTKFMGESNTSLMVKLTRKTNIRGRIGHGRRQRPKLLPKKRSLAKS